MSESSFKICGKCGYSGVRDWEHECPSCDKDPSPYGVEGDIPDPHNQTAVTGEVQSTDPPQSNGIVEDVGLEIATIIDGYLPADGKGTERESARMQLNTEIGMLVQKHVQNSREEATVCPTCNRGVLTVRGAYPYAMRCKSCCTHFIETPKAAQGNVPWPGPGWEYELLIDDEEGTPFQINDWIPIATDMIRHPEKIEEYIEKGMLRRIERDPIAETIKQIDAVNEIAESMINDDPTPLSGEDLENAIMMFCDVGSRRAADIAQRINGYGYTLNAPITTP